MAVSFTGKYGCAFIAVLLLVCSLPVTAAPLYSQGSPDLTASVTGTNEFLPGEDATIAVLIQNTGVNLFKQVNHGTIAQEDLPNTAKLVTVELTSGTPLISVRTDPQMVGDIAGGGGYATASFSVKIAANATRQDYVLPLAIRYKYPVVTAQETSDSYTFVYGTAEQTIPLTIRIKPGAKAEVLGIGMDSLTPGSEGVVNITIRNTGPADGETAIAKITRNGQSPVIPVDSSVFIGEFGSGETVSCLVRVSVSSDAEEEQYPLDVSVAYTDEEGSVRTTSPVTVGIPVAGKPRFGIVSQPLSVPAGSGMQVAVEYRNTGTVTVYSAQSRITAHSPVTIGDNVAYLGDIPPGESATALYMIQADAGAEPGEYSFDSKIRYRDAFANSVESDTIPVQISVVPASAGGLATPAVATGIVLVIGAIAVLLVYWYRKKRQ